jgi:hypothetical protein
MPDWNLTARDSLKRGFRKVRRSRRPELAAKPTYGQLGWPSFEGDEPQGL